MSTTEPQKINVLELQIKTMFGKITEVIISSISSRKDCIDIMRLVTKWCALIVASMIVMIEKDKTMSNKMASNFSMILNEEIEIQMHVIREMSKEAKEKDEKKIIVPGE